jgi:pyruvoyl-dependent arginine decarboxylase (PvlArgDC)
MVTEIHQWEVTMNSQLSRPQIVVPDHVEADHDRLTIAVVAGVGEGQTLLSAFDAALWRAGTHNYNLVPLSSVIPPGSAVVNSGRRAGQAAEFGHRLYVVKAEARSAEPGHIIGRAWDGCNGATGEASSWSTSSHARTARVPRWSRS